MLSVEYDRLGLKVISNVTDNDGGKIVWITGGKNEALLVFSFVDNASMLRTTT